MWGRRGERSVEVWMGQMAIRMEKTADGEKERSGCGGSAACDTPHTVDTPPHDASTSIDIKLKPRRAIRPSIPIVLQLVSISICSPEQCQ